jgi:hypothetical protein
MCPSFGNHVSSLISALDTNKLAFWTGCANLCFLDVEQYSQRKCTGQVIESWLRRSCGKLLLENGLIQLSEVIGGRASTEVNRPVPLSRNNCRKEATFTTETIRGLRRSRKLFSALYPAKSLGHIADICEICIAISHEKTSRKRVRIKRNAGCLISLSNHEGYAGG